MGPNSTWMAEKGSLDTETDTPRREWCECSGREPVFQWICWCSVLFMKKKNLLLVSLWLSEHSYQFLILKVWTVCCFSPSFTSTITLRITIIKKTNIFLSAYSVACACTKSFHAILSSSMVSTPLGRRRYCYPFYKGENCSLQKCFAQCQGRFRPWTQVWLRSFFSYCLSAPWTQSG